jgi:hypothetical protein
MDELKDIGRRILADACVELKENKNIVPKLVLGDAMDETPTTMVIVDPSLVSSTEAKKAFAAKIKKEIAAHGYTYVVILLDMFRLGVRGERERAALRMLHGEMKIPLDKLAAAGLGELCEMLQVQIQSMTDSVSLSVEYARNEDGSIKEMKEVVEMPGFSHGLFKFF